MLGKRKKNRVYLNEKHVANTVALSGELVHTAWVR